jgi:protein SCO1/2
MARVRDFFAGGRFAAFMLAALGSYYALLLTIVLWPAGDGEMARFAEGFRRWCLSADQGTGRVSGLAMATLLGEPLLLGGIVLAIWWRPLRHELAAPRRLLPSAAAALTVVAAVLGLLGARIAPAAGAADPDAFPGERIRTAIPAAPFSLVDQDGRAVGPEALRGRVLVITAIYSSCGATCPMIMAQTRRVLEQLSPEEREGLSVLAITLDPEHDDRERLRQVAEVQDVRAPQVHLLTGDPGEVNRVLDRYGFERRRDPETGIIDHANLFVVVDRRGAVAYRFTLGERQERWLGTAIRQLLREP